MSTADTNHDCCIPQERTDEHFVERHAAFLRRTMEGPIDLLFLGDSITRRWAEVPDLWTLYFGRYRAANFAIGSDTIQSMLWRLRNGELAGIAPRVVVLLIGANNAPTNNGIEIAAGVRKVVETARQALPESALLLLAIFPRGPQNPVRSTAEDAYYMDRIIVANRHLSDLRDAAAIRFLDLGPQFLQSDGEIDPRLLPDRLHLVRPGFAVWGECMGPVLQEMMATR